MRTKFTSIKYLNGDILASSHHLLSLICLLISLIFCQCVVTNDGKSKTYIQYSMVYLVSKILPFLPPANTRRYTPGQVHPFGEVHPLAGTSPWQVNPQQVHPQQVHPQQCMVGYSQQVGGMHPTGMHSCYVYFYSIRNSKKLLKGTYSPYALQTHQIYLKNEVVVNTGRNGPVVLEVYRLNLASYLY